MLTMPQQRAESMLSPKMLRLLTHNIQVNAILPIAKTRMTDALAEFQVRGETI